MDEITQTEPAPAAAPAPEAPAAPVVEPVETTAPPPIQEEVIPHVETVQTQEETPQVDPPATAAVPPATAEPPTVPLARMQGIQKQLSQLQKDLATANAQTQNFRDLLAASDKRAASELAERLRATQPDIVPSLISGETVADVEKSLAISKSAYAAAAKTYALKIPVPSGNPSASQSSPQSPKSPLDLLRSGLTQPKKNINS